MSVKLALLGAAAAYVFWAHPYVLYAVCAVLVPALAFIVYWWKVKDWYKDIDPRIPRVHPEGPIGAASSFDERHFPRTLEAFARKYGKIVAFRLVEHIEIQITDADLCLEVMQKCSEKPLFLYRVLIPIIGENSLVIVGGERWKMQREILQKAFHASYVPAFTEVMYTATQPLIKTLRSLGPTETINIDHEFVNLTIRVIASAMFSHSWEGKDGAVLISKLLEVTQSMARTVRAPWLKLNPLFTRRFQSASAFLRQNFRSILEEHRRTLGQRPKADMVDVMISEKEGGKGLTDDDIIDQILTFFFAGHDTTAHTLAWAVHEISSRPDIEAKVIEEVDQVLSSCPDGKLSASAASGLTYLNWVIKETLRMRPPVAVYNRCPTEDITVGGYQIKKGASIAIVASVIHYDEAYYPDPYRFNPDRWRDRPASHTWLPFAYLQRTCIGRDFALLELRVVLALLYASFTFRVDTQRIVGPTTQITTLPFEGLHIYARPRTAAPSTTK